MNIQKTVLRLTGTIFGIVALLHLLRIVTKITVNIGKWEMPLWVNVLGFIGATVLSVFLWKISGKNNS